LILAVVHQCASFRTTLSLASFLVSSGPAGAAPALLRMLRGCVQCAARYPPVFFSSIPRSCIEPPNYAVSTPTMMV